MKDPCALTLAQSVLDGLGQALIVVDRDRRIRMRNLGAQRLLDAAAIFREEDGRLAGATPTLDSELDDAIAGLDAEGPVRTIKAPGGSIAFIKRLPIEGPAPLALLAFAELQDQAPESSLAAMFHLTPAEARVALRLARGCTPKQIATDCQVSASTVRSQVQSVFEKVGVHRQADLVRMLLLASAA